MNKNKEKFIGNIILRIIPANNFNYESYELLYWNEQTKKYEQ